MTSNTTAQETSENAAAAGLLPEPAITRNKLARPVRPVHVAIAVVLLVLFAARLAAIYTENINWDEFGLLHRAVQTKETGRMQGGGRPGLVVLMLLPFVQSCEDEIAVMQHVRVLWTVITVAFLAGLYVLLRRLHQSSRHAARDALLGVACLAMIPPFLRWSIQVRTDQPELALLIWAGVALLASRTRRAWALVSGILLGAGYLCTQKAVYLVPVLAILALGDLLLARDHRLRHALVRGALCALGAGGTVLAYGRLLPHFLLPAPALTAEGVGKVFDFYRQVLGFSQYKAMAPFLVPHGVMVLLVLLACASPSRWRRSEGKLSAHSIRLSMALGVLASGLAVALFHAGAFYYFWMTLGCFVAIGISVAQEPVRCLFVGQWQHLRRPLLVAFWLGLLGPGVIEVGNLLRDTQAVQANSFEFIHRNFSKRDAGFHPESALFCQRDPRPFPTYFSQQITFRFTGPDGRKNVRQMIADFMDKPVKFILDSWRVYTFPRAIFRFWVENYQPYRDAVWIPRRHIEGQQGVPIQVDIFVPGRFRWVPADESGRIEIDGAIALPGEVVTLARGPHQVVFKDQRGAGILVFAVKDLPTRARQPFYKPFSPW